MPFIQDAQDHLRRKVLPTVEERLRSEQYVNRYVIKEGVDARLLELKRGIGQVEDNSESFRDDELFKLPKMILIGNSGSGKSLIISYAFVRASHQFLLDSTSPFPFFLDLGNALPENLSIVDALNYWSDGLFNRFRSEHQSSYALFLDGLDEALRKAPRFINDLRIFLREESKRLGQIIITCRRSQFQSDWFQAEPMAMDIYHADYLETGTYAQIIPDILQCNQFFEACTNLGIQDLLATPFDGFYLAREYQQGRQLLTTRSEILNQRITKALEGSQGDRSEGQAPAVERLRFLAGQLACLASFTSNSTWSPQDAVNLLGESSILWSDGSIQVNEIAVLLNRPLFIKIDQRFAFNHQLHREFLTAERLQSLSLRKQRQLLEAELPGRELIRTPHRGIATDLAETSEAFRNYLINTNPFIALHAEISFLSRIDIEQLLRSVLDDAINNKQSPFWESGPRGERPIDMIAKYRPGDVAGFLRPYLESADEFARVWGVACAESWEGANDLNEVLSRLAHDAQQDERVRISAINAIAATNNREQVRELYDLFDVANDSIRGAVIRAYRKVEQPSPRSFIQRFRGGMRQSNVFGLLQVEILEYLRALSSSQISEAFQAVEEEFDELGDLKIYFLEGLFNHAAKIGFYEVPAALILQCWISDNTGLSAYEKALQKIFKENPVLFGELWGEVMTLLATQNGRVYWSRLARPVAEVCSDQIFDLLPPSSEGLNVFQERLISEVLDRYFQQNPTAERLLLFKQRAPDFTQYLRPPIETATHTNKRDFKKSPSKWLTWPPQWLIEKQAMKKERQSLSNAIKAGANNPVYQTSLILTTIVSLEYRSVSELNEKDVLRVLKRLDSDLRDQIIGSFTLCVASITYERIQQGSAITMTNRLSELPFWVLRESGVAFEPEKIAEIFLCYAFESTGQPRYENLLEELRQRDRRIWERCMIEEVENRGDFIREIIDYLIKLNERVYIERCQERLRQGAFDGGDIDDLLKYLMTFKPDGYTDTLQQCYLNLRDNPLIQAQGARQGLDDEQAASGTEAGSPNASRGPFALNLIDQFHPLFILMLEDNDWAWQEFQERLQREEVPIQRESYHEDATLQLPPDQPRLSTDRVPVLADWYALARRSNNNFTSLASDILDLMVATDGFRTIQELRRLQETDAFPAARFLGRTIKQIEDQLLIEGSATWSSGYLLDFINQLSMGVIRNERDLFEWVCEAIEELEKIFSQGEAVAGFWNVIASNSESPKTETHCQNVLWPLLRFVLQRSGIPTVEIEERYVGANRCDFWIEYPRAGLEPLRVEIELKVARNNYGNADLIDPVENQLWDRYLRPTNCRHGVFIVLWFRDGNRYNGPSAWTNREALASQIRERCNVVSLANQVSLASYVLDMTAPYRRR